MGLLRGAEVFVGCWVGSCLGVGVGLGMSSGVVRRAGNGDWVTGTSNAVVDVGCWMLDERNLL